LPLKTSVKLIFLGFGVLESYYSLGTGKPEADSCCSELFPLPTLVCQDGREYCHHLSPHKCAVLTATVPPAPEASRHKLIKNKDYCNNFIEQSQLVK